jgi:hypothetical protein
MVETLMKGEPKEEGIRWIGLDASDMFAYEETGHVPVTGNN